MRGLLLRKFVLFSVLPAIVLSALVLGFLYRERLRAQRQFAEAQAAASAARIAQALERPTVELLHLLRSSEIRAAVRSGPEHYRTEALAKLSALIETTARNRLSYIVGCRLLDLRGHPILQWGRPWPATDEPDGVAADYFTGALHLAAIRGQRAPVHIAHAGGDAPVIYSALVTDDAGAIFGVAAIAADFRPLLREMALSGYHRLIGLLDSRGDPIAEGLLGRNAREILRETRGAILTETGGVAKEEGWPLDRIVAFARVRPSEQASIQWTALFDVPSRGVVAYYKWAALSLAGAGAAVLLLAAGAALLLSHRVAQPIVQLARAAERLREGDWDAPLPTVRRPSEIVRLAETFRRTRDDLCRSQRELKDKLDALQKSETALAVEKERLAVILCAINDAVIAIDLEGRVRFANRAAERMLGLSAQHMAGNDLKTILRGFDPSTGEPQDLTRTPVAATRPASSDLKIVRADGSSFLAECAISPVLNPDGERIGAILALKDVTLERQAEKERIRDERIRSLGVLAGGIAHDFNNLLGIIIGNGSLLLDLPRESGEEVSRIAHEILDAAERSRALSNQLLVFAKGGAPIKREAALREIVEESLAFATRGSPCRYRIESPPQLWMVLADPDQMHQVFHNLALNAVHAMPNGGEIHVRLENVEARENGAIAGLKPGPYIRAWFRDFGVGIPPENLPHIFEPYFTTKPGGHGLGLSTAHGILAAHGGAIRVHPRDPGVEFEVYIPARAGAAPGKPPPAAAPPSAAAPLRVLLLEDDLSLAKMTGKMLEHLGHTVKAVAEGRACVEAFEEAAENGRPFDLVIADLTIRGGMGGAEAVNILRRRHPGLRAIASSGYSQGAVMANAAQHGFSAVLPKPFTLPNLRAAISEALSGNQAAAT